MDFSGESYTVLDRILNAESLVLPGGLQAVFKDQSIHPSCCCGLESWREWQVFLITGDSPWLGHSPSPWIEAKNDRITIWSDDGLDESIQLAFQIEVSRSTFRQALQNVEQDLQNFLYCVDSWVQTIGFKPSKHLVQKINDCFDIGNSHTKLPT